MINTGAKVQILRQVLDLVARLLIVLHIFFVALSLFGAELPLKHIWERVWHLCFASEYSSDQGGSLNTNSINRSKVSGVEAVFDKRLNVKLQVEPDAFENHP